MDYLVVCLKLCTQGWHLWSKEGFSCLRAEFNHACLHAANLILPGIEGYITFSVWPVQEKDSIDGLCSTAGFRVFEI